MKNILRRVTRAAASTALVFTLLDVSAMAKAQGTWDGQRAVVVKYGRTALDTPSGRAALEKKSVERQKMCVGRPLRGLVRNRLPWRPAAMPPSRAQTRTWQVGRASRRPGGIRSQRREGDELR
jgi:hypothetical protein